MSGLPVARKPESAGVAGSAEDGPVAVRPSLGVRSDEPLKDDRDDCLGYGDLADALAELIDHPKTDTPLTIALSAPWGAGKTTLARMVERRLLTLRDQRGEPQHITCWFNAWMHDDAAHLGSAFAAEVAKQANRHRTIFRRFVKPLPSAILSPSRRARLRLYVVGTSLIVAGLAAFPLRKSQLLNFIIPADVQNIQSTYGLESAALLLLIVPVIFAAWTRFFSVAQAVAGFVKDPTKESATGSMHEVSEQLGGLLREATGGKRRFVIFVDDIERCKPPRAVEVCEVASQLLSHPDVVTVLIGDMASIAACADVQYAALDGRYPIINSQQVSPGSFGETYGQMYLEKIVQIQFEIPIPSALTMQRLVNSSSTHEIPHEPQVNSSEKDHVLALPAPGRLEVASRRGWKIALLLIVVLAILGGIFDPSGESSSIAINIIDFIIGILILLALPGFVLIRIFLAAQRRLRRRVAHRKKIAVDEQIKQHAETDDSHVDQLAAKIKSQSGENNRGLVTQRAQRYLIDESPVRQQADAELLPFLPPLPRAAKRLFNMQRMLLAVAVRRGMLGGQPEMTAKHLAKWAVLMSRWPELSATLRAAPVEIASLEEAVDINRLADRLRELNYRRPVTEDLFLVLQSSTKLTPVMTRLVAYEPVIEDENVPTAIQ